MVVKRRKPSALKAIIVAIVALLCCWLILVPFLSYSMVLYEPTFDSPPKRMETAATIAPVEMKPTKPQIEERIRWVFTTDCSAYQFNQGNMLLASAVHTRTAGTWTWIIYGCEPLIENDVNEVRRKKALKQREYLGRLAHPNCSVFYMEAKSLTHPDTGVEIQHFQASNRPLSLLSWWKETKHDFKEKALVIIDPDMFFVRPVVFEKRASSEPLKSDQRAAGPWKVPMVRGIGGGAEWPVGCPIQEYKDNITQLCGDRQEICRKVASLSTERCQSQYGSGPPWVLPIERLDEVLNDFLPTSVRMHFVSKNHMLSEQYSIGIAQILNGMSNELDSFWYMAHANNMPEEVNDWDPCAEQTILPPSHYSGMPPLLHTCYTYDITGTTGYRLHKDHIHKDILDCSAPLLRYPPRDTLIRLRGTSRSDFNNAWLVCFFTNNVNFYATQYKKQFCHASQINLNPVFEYPPHGHLYLNQSADIAAAFRPGGWQDKDLDFLQAKHVN